MRKKIKNLKKFAEFVEMLRTKSAEMYEQIDQDAKERKADVDKWAIDCIKDYKKWEERF